VFLTDDVGRMLDTLASAFIAIELRVAVLGIAAVLMSLALRRASAAVRHLVWRGLLIGALVLPVATLVSASNRIEVRLHVTPPTKDWSLFDTPGAIDTIDSAATAPVSRIAAWLVALWMAGALSLLGAQLRSYAAVRRIRRRARPVDSRWQPTIDDAFVALELARRVAVLRSTDIDVPVACGSVRPVVIVPAASDEWPPEVRDAVLRHELAHVARGDVAFAVFARFMCALHWVNPFVWLSARRAMLEAERAADDAVLQSGVTPSTYSALLLDFATDLRPARTSTLAFARISSLEERVRAILNPTQSRRRVKRRAAVVLVPMLMAVSGLVGSTRLSAEPRARLTAPAAAAPSAGVLDTTDPVGALIATMNDESPHVRAAAASSLGAFGDLRARPSLTRALDDSSATVRFYAERALRSLRSAP